MTVKLGLQRTIDAYNDWIVDSIVNAGKEKSDLGKFLFGVTSGSVGSLVAISEISANKWGVLEWFALGAFLVSGFLALLIAMPQRHDIKHDTDLQVAHRDMVNSAWNATLLWAGSWTIAVGLAAWGFSA